MKKYLFCLIIFQTLFAFELLALPKYSSDNFDDNWDIQARIRNGKTGFEGVLFTPEHNEPNGQVMNPSGAPIWNSNGNKYGVNYFNFRVSYDYKTGNATQEIDFNHDGDFDDSHERVTSTSSSLSGMGFKYINLRIQGQVGQNAHVILKNFTINDVNFGDFQTTNSNHLITKLFDEDSDCGLFTEVIVTGTFTFTKGQSDELPRIWIRFGASQEVDEKKCGGLISGLITLVDENGDALANFGYPEDIRQLKWKYRCGGTWGPENSFETDESGQLYYIIDCPDNNWDNKITVTLNQTSIEQDVTINPIFQAAKVNVNLKYCAGDALSDGTVSQGGGYWFTHGSTGSIGTVSFYAFPGKNIKVKMSYNYGNNTIDATTVTAPVTDIDFTTTTVNLAPGPVQIGVSGWPTVTMPMQMLPGTYNFRLNGTQVNDVVVSACNETPSAGVNMVLLSVKNESNQPVGGAQFIPAIGGSWQSQIPGATDANGNLLAAFNPSWTKIKAEVNNSSQELTKAQLESSGYVWTTQLIRINFLDAAGNAITDEKGEIRRGGGWPLIGKFNSSGYFEVSTFPANIGYRVNYNNTSETKTLNIVAGAGVQEFNFQTGQVFGSCITQYSAGGWTSFTNGMELMPGTYTFRYPSQSGTVVAGQITYLNCPPSKRAVDMTSSVVYPNPVTDMLIIGYDVEEASNVRIYITDITGQMVAELFNDYQEAGNYEINWNTLNQAGSRVSVGTYFYVISTMNNTQSGAIQIVR
jgi:hypothetical protein